MAIHDGLTYCLFYCVFGGRTLDYRYADAATPAAIAPRPGLLIRMADRFGHALDFAYDAAARLVRVTDPAGGLYDYAHDSTGNLAAVTYPDGRRRRYHYNEAALINGGAACPGRPNGLPRALTGVTDETGVRYAKAVGWVGASRKPSQSAAWGAGFRSPQPSLPRCLRRKKTSRLKPVHGLVVHGHPWAAAGQDQARPPEPHQREGGRFGNGSLQFGG